MILRRVTALGLFALAGCSNFSLPSIGLGESGPPAGQPGFVRGFLGAVVAEEPRAALVAREVLSAGGSATDAAVAAGFALAVTLPSRAGLGGGGACLVYDRSRNQVEAVVFPPGSRGAPPPDTDRPAASPALARGLFALHTRGGRRPFEEVMAPAEQLARFGTEVSRALAADFAVVGPALLADPWARAQFGPGGQPLQAGARMLQTDLAGTLSAMRISGVGDLSQGALARRFEEAARAAGGGLTLADLRATVPQLVPAQQLRVGNDNAAFLPASLAGGAATAATFTALQGGADGATARDRGLAEARGGLRPLPASTGLAVVDREGGAVACAFTMNNLFGTGRVAGGTGVLLAAAPGFGAVEPPLLAAILVTNPNLRAFRYAGAGSGQSMAALAVAGPAVQHLLRNVAVDAALAAGVPDPGRALAIGCTRYLPVSPGSCDAAADPRGAGVALSGER